MLALAEVMTYVCRTLLHEVQSDHVGKKNDHIAGEDVVQLKDWCEVWGSLKCSICWSCE